MMLPPKTFLAIALSVILSVASVIGAPSMKPQIASDVEPDIKEAFTALMDAYISGDGATAFDYLDTSLERSVLIEGLRITPIPLLNLSVYSYDADTINLAYDLPHPGDILAAIQNGGDNPSTVRKNIEQLRYGDDLTRRFETWHIVRDEGHIKFFFNNNGFMRLSSQIGGQVDYYITGPDKHTLETASFPGIPLENRMVIMLVSYFDCLEIEITSIEGKRLVNEIALKIKTLPQTTPNTEPKIVSPKDLKEVSLDEITMKVPKSWISQTRKLRQSGPNGIAYASYDSNDNPVLVSLVNEMDTKAAPELRDKSDQHILTVCCLVNRSKLLGELLNYGDLTIDGSPSTYFLEDVKSNDSENRILTYLVVRDGVLYSLKFLCYEESFNGYFDLFETIKDSLRFR